MGLVSQVFSPADLERLKGTRAIGHVRYSTTGSSNVTNAQPLMVDCARGQLAIAHNGNITNAAELRDGLEQRGSIFQTTVDSEIILHLLAQPNDQNGVLAALRRVHGAYSLIIMGEREIIGLRDPFGFRPLALGMLDGAYVLSSETCAFDLIHAEFIREIEPGEVVIIDETGIRSEFPFKTEKKAFCMFEYVYFARPDSIISDVNVARVRTAMGRELARLHPIDADLVVPVPDSGNYAALGFAEELAIPYNHAFVRNHYIGRTFLQPTQLIRDFNVRVKLNLIKEAVAGKRVVVVDDSIVRGTTARARVVNLREAGAKEVHMRISCPPHRFACHYGIDFRIRRSCSRTSARWIRSAIIWELTQSVTSMWREWSAPQVSPKRISASRASRVITHPRSIQTSTNSLWSSGSSARRCWAAELSIRSSLTRCRLPNTFSSLIRSRCPQN
jgi:amidophosphoribosyltransferase